MSTIRVNAIQNTTANDTNMTLFANGNVAITTANTTLRVGNTVISNAGISVGGSAINPLATGMRNRIINGDFRIDQRNNGASANSGSSGGNYTLDRWSTFVTGGGVFSSQQSSIAPTGFTNSQIITVTSADSSIAAGDVYQLRTTIEGLNCADLAWGTANAKTVTLSFWVRSSVTGTFSVSLRNYAGDRSYVATYTINAVNTWEYETITIPGDTTGTWLTTNSGFCYLTWSLGAGSTWETTAGSWQAGNSITTSVSVDLISTVGATFYFTGVQLEEGTVATPFEFRQYGQELALCQRYYWRNNASATWTFARQPCVVVMGSTTGGSMVIINPVPMRAVPVSVDFNALALYDGANLVAISNLVLDQSSTLAAAMSITVTGATVFRNYIVMGNSSASSYLGISAEL